MAVLDVDMPELVTVNPEVHENYVEILDLHEGQKLVTVIELISPTNKLPGVGRDSYVQKQREVLSSDVHLVEIDLPRTGQHVAAVPEHLVRERFTYDYLVSVNRAEGYRDRFQVYPRRLADRLPRIGIPLAAGDADVRLDLPAVLNQAYEAGVYRDRLRYDAPCRPPLSDSDQAWANGLIEQARPLTE